MAENDMQNTGYSHRICCSKSTHDKLLIDCKAEILSESPELKDFNLSQNYILERVCKWFLK